MRWIVGVMAAMLVLAAGLGQAQPAPKRLALIIGNGAYATPGWALTNPARDAALVGERLKALGFEVTLVTDANRVGMESAFDRFGAALKAAGPDAVSFFYYAGHGAQAGGANYLVPVDATAQTMDRLRYQSPPLQFLLDDMIEAGNAVNIVVLDACRNLPLPEGSRSVGGDGLADLGKPQNFFIAYATSPGRTAADGGGQNSPYATALSAALQRQSEDPVELLFSDVDSRVYRATEGAQTPEYRNGLLRAPRWSLASGRDAPPAPTIQGVEFRDCDVCPLMVVLPAGSFMMGPTDGDEPGSRQADPQRRVTIARPFAVGKFEVTFAEWDACVAGGGCAPQEEGPYRPDDWGWGRGARPVMQVSWQDAKLYLRWLNGKVGGRAYRLLAEAEWEYAARAGTTTAFFTGAGIAQTQAQFRTGKPGERVLATDPRGTATVGSFPANAFKLHDMHGNVWEWVEDCYHYDLSRLALDGSASVWEGCPARVVRGGSWQNNPDNLQSATRADVAPGNRRISIGFRVARIVP